AFELASVPRPSIAFSPANRSGMHQGSQEPRTETTPERAACRTLACPATVAAKSPPNTWHRHELTQPGLEKPTKNSDPGGAPPARPHKNSARLLAKLPAMPPPRMAARLRYRFFRGGVERMTFPVAAGSGGFLGGS